MPSEYTATKLTTLEKSKNLFCHVDSTYPSLSIKTLNDRLSFAALLQMRVLNLAFNGFLIAHEIKYFLTRSNWAVAEFPVN